MPPRGLVYVLRSYPELSETFIVREVEALRAAGVPVTVLSAFRPDATAPTAPAAIYLDGRRDGGTERGETLDRPSLVRALVSDVAALRFHPRRAARATRLALFAMRAARAIPEGTSRLHAHFANDAATLARYVAALTGLPYRVTAHAYDLFQDPFLLRENLAGAETIYTVSDVNAAWLTLDAASRGWDASRVRVLHCGLDLARFAFREPPAFTSAPKILCVGRLVPKKGHAILLEAVALLRESGLDATIEIVGDGPLASDLEAKASSLKLAGAVRFRGALAPEEAARAMKNADVLALASRVAADGDRDGLPVVLVEAMALGLPVVATRVAGIPELVAEDTGFLAPPDDPPALAAALRASLTEPQASRLARARRARRTVETGWNLAAQVRELKP